MLKRAKPFNEFIRISYIATRIMSPVFLVLLFFTFRESLFNLNEDATHNDVLILKHLHIASACTALFIYSFIFLSSLIAFIYGSVLFYFCAVCSASIAAIFAFISIVVGSLLDKTIWGIWCVWDKSSIYMIVVLGSYLVYLVITKIYNIFQIKKCVPLIFMLNLLNVPILSFSLSSLDEFTMQKSYFFTVSSIMSPLFFLIFATFIVYYIIVTLLKIEILIYKFNTTN